MGRSVAARKHPDDCRQQHGEAAVRNVLRARRKEDTKGVWTIALCGSLAIGLVAYLWNFADQALSAACVGHVFETLASFEEFPSERTPWHSGAPGSIAEYAYGLFCDGRWRFWDHPWRVVPTQLASDPLLYVFDDFLSSSEVNAVLKLVSDLDFFSSGLKDSVDMGYRSSRTSFFPPGIAEEDPVLLRIARRIHATAHVPLSHGELLQVVEYREGDKYELHLDADPDVPRVATMILYLSDVDGGGETVWPHNLFNGSLQEGPLPKPTNGSETRQPMQPYCDHQSYLKVQPKKGRAVLMYNLKREAVWGDIKQTMVNENSLHGACPVRGKRSKWVLQKWMQYKSLA